MELRCRGVNETKQVVMTEVSGEVQVKQEFVEQDSQQEEEGHQRWEHSIMDYVDLVDPDCMAEMAYIAFREEAFFFSDD